mmetsp:Transcript_23664/g.69970  ORF Transcript_23664/g.69970 Transcript_23664/m.69970 type:complete len:203 (-) Transcript_23664:69-677(-)
MCQTRRRHASSRRTSSRGRRVRAAAPRHSRRRALPPTKRRSSTCSSRTRSTGSSMTTTTRRRRPRRRCSALSRSGSGRSASEAALRATRRPLPRSVFARSSTATRSSRACSTRHWSCWWCRCSRWCARSLMPAAPPSPPRCGRRAASCTRFARFAATRRWSSSCRTRRATSSRWSGCSARWRRRTETPGRSPTPSWSGCQWL